jgi:hypothetical protein
MLTFVTFKQTAEELYETMRYPEGSPEAPGHQEEVVQVEEQTEGVYDWIKRRAQKFAQ